MVKLGAVDDKHTLVDDRLHRDHSLLCVLQRVIKIQHILPILNGFFVVVTLRSENNFRRRNLIITYYIKVLRVCGTFRARVADKTSYIPLGN